MYRTMEYYWYIITRRKYIYIYVYIYMCVYGTSVLYHIEIRIWMRQLPEAQAYYRGLTGGVIIPSEVQKLSSRWRFLRGSKLEKCGRFNTIEHGDCMGCIQEKQWFTEVYWNWNIKNGDWLDLTVKNDKRGIFSMYMMTIMGIEWEWMGHNETEW